MFAPIVFVHPLRVQKWRWVNIAACLVFLGLSGGGDPAGPTRLDLDQGGLHRGGRLFPRAPVSCGIRPGPTAEIAPCLREAKLAIAARRRSELRFGMASWRSGYAEDCKSLHPGSIPGEASNPTRHHRSPEGASGSIARGGQRMATNWLDVERSRPRLHMVNGQLRTSDVTDLQVLGAFLDVPREALRRAFAEEARLSRRRTPRGGGRAATAAGARGRSRVCCRPPATAPGERALDVGGGSGYSAALLDGKSALRSSCSNPIEAPRSLLAKPWRVAPASRSSREISRLGRPTRRRSTSSRQRRVRDDADAHCSTNSPRAAGWSASMRAPARRAASSSTSPRSVSASARCSTPGPTSSRRSGVRPVSCFEFAVSSRALP